MSLPAGPEPRTVLRGEEVVLRPLEPSDADTLREIVATPKVARWWFPNEDPRWPTDDDPDAARYAVLVDGQVAGLIQYGEEPDPQYRRAEIDVFLDPRVHGRGLGADAVRTLCRHLVGAAGHHRVAVDPSVANAAAIRCFEKVGFRRVGVLRRHERNWQSGTWRDALLLDLLPEDLS